MATEKMEKINKRMKFEMLKTFVPEDSEHYAMLMELLDGEITAIDNKKKKAQQRAAAVKAEGDEMRAIVESALTDEWAPISAILETIGDESFTKGKVAARLGALVKMGIAEKQSQSVDGKRTMHYRLVPED